MLLDDGGAARWLLNFCGNDYLGLAGSETLRNALAAGIAQGPGGAGRARAGH